MALVPFAQMGSAVDSRVIVTGTVKKVMERGFWIFRRYRVEVEVPQSEAAKILAATEKTQDLGRDADREAAKELFSVVPLNLAGSGVYIPEVGATVEVELGFRGVLTQFMTREPPRACLSICPA